MNKENLYSKDYNFFLQEQIGIVTTNNGKHTKFFSRLNGKLFKEIDGNRALTESEESEHCKTIHNNQTYYD
jgi:hypothetical protein